MEENHGGRWLRQIHKQEQQSVTPMIFPHLQSCLLTYHHHHQRRNLPDTQASYNQIDLDIPRTFPTHAFFAQPTSLGQQELQRVLSAYVSWENAVFAEKDTLTDTTSTTTTLKYNASVRKCGYVQGMNMIAGHLLLHINELHSFHIFSHLMVNPKFNMQHILRNGMDGLHLKLHHVQHLMEFYLPSTANCLAMANVPLLFFCTEWVITLFAYVFDGPFLNTFFDLFLEHGWVSFYQVTLALLKSVEQDLLQAANSGLGGNDVAEGNLQVNVLSIVKGIGRRSVKYNRQEEKDKDGASIFKSASSFDRMEIERLVAKNGRKPEGVGVL